MGLSKDWVPTRSVFSRYLRSDREEFWVLAKLVFPFNTMKQTFQVKDSTEVFCISDLLFPDTFDGKCFAFKLSYHRGMHYFCIEYREITG
jgi:hypothetical protein